MLLRQLIYLLAALNLVLVVQSTTAQENFNDRVKETTDNARKDEQFSEDAESASFWKKKHERRTKTNQQVAKLLRTTTGLQSRKAISEVLVSASRKLPINGRQATRIRSLIDELLQSKATTKSSAKANEPRELKSIRREIGQIAAELSFEPILNTRLPEKYAAPTPVGEIEIKYYPPARMAETTLGTDPTTRRGRSAFARLLAHIQDNKIEMTSPVLLIYERSDKGLKESSMRFLYPNLTTGKLSKEGNVKVSDQPAISVISMGIRGHCDKKCIESAAEGLRKHSLKYLAAFKLSNEIRVLGYNDPSVPKEDQFFEVQIKLIKVGKNLKKRT